MTDEQMSKIVREARCRRCDGKGFRLVPVEDHAGERIPGHLDKMDCKECSGNGIHLGICRRLAYAFSRNASGPAAEEGQDE